MKKSASADDIRKAFRKLARKYHPDVNPGDKAAEEKFKTLSEANDVLSDPKKRKIYDQVGFYSDNIDPATAEAYARAGGGAGGFPARVSRGAQPGRRRPGRQLRFRRLRLFRHVRKRRGAERPAARGSGQLPRHFLRHVRRARRRRRRRARSPGSDLEYQVNVPFWTAIRGGVMRLNITRRDACANCHGQGFIEAPRNLPGVRRQGTGHADRRADEVQCALSALPRDGQEHLDLPDLPWRRHGRTHRTARSPDQGRDARRPAHPPRRQGQRRSPRRPGRRSLRDHPHRRPPGLPARRRRHSHHGAGDRHGSGAGRQD